MFWISIQLLHAPPLSSVSSGSPSFEGLEKRKNDEDNAKTSASYLLFQESTSSILIEALLRKKET